MLHDSIRYQDGLPVSTTPLALSHVLEIGQKWRGSDILSSAKGRFSLLLRFRLHSSRSGRFRENPLPCLKIVADYSGALYSLCEISGNVSAYWEWIQLWQICGQITDAPSERFDLVLLIN